MGTDANISGKDIGVSRLIFGTAGLTALPTHRQASLLLAEAEASGIHHFDTAPLYGKGYAEWILGLYLAKRRSRALVTTKFGLGPATMPSIHPSLALPLNYFRKRLKRKSPEEAHKHAPSPSLPYRRLTREQVQTSLKGSQLRLGRRHIDVFLLHEGLPSFLEPEALDLLLRLKSEGVLGRIGIGTNAAVLAGADAEDFSPFDILQYEAGPHTQTLLARYTRHEHFLHSCFRAGSYHNPDSQEQQHPLTYWSAQNPGGKLLFFTQRKERVRENAHTCA